MKRTFKTNCLILLISLSFSVIIAGCTNKGGTINLDNLKKELNNISYGYDYNRENHMLRGSKRVIPVKNENIVVYDYDNNSSMEVDSLTISIDGNTVGNSMVEWSSIPHFYKNDRSIVQYVGKDIHVIESLNTLLGDQFAGQ